MPAVVGVGGEIPEQVASIGATVGGDVDQSAGMDSTAPLAILIDECQTASSISAGEPDSSRRVLTLPKRRSGYSRLLTT